MAGYTLPFLIAKSSGIAYVTTIYFFIGIFVARAFDMAYGEFRKEDYIKDGKVRKLYLTASLIAHVIVYALVFYFLRNVVERIPFPLEGLGGYEHHRLKELEGGPIMEFVGLLFQRHLKEKVGFFMEGVLGQKGYD